MLPPQLYGSSSSTSLHRAALHSATRLPKISALPLLLSTSPATQQQRSFWKYNPQAWDSPSDSAYHYFHRRRYQRARAEFRDAVKRRSQWQKPGMLTGVVGSRSASHWGRGRKRWSTMENDIAKVKAKPKDPATNSNEWFELSPGEKRWKKRIEAMKERVENDPYRAVFGKPLEPFWSPSLWSSFVPWANPQQSSAHNYHTGKPDTDDATGGAPTAGKAPQDNASGDEGADIASKQHVETSSFSFSSQQKPGTPPLINASASSWDSCSNELKAFEYDPISGRMRKIQSEGRSGNPKPDVSQLPESHAGSERGSTRAKLPSLAENDLDFVTAEDVRASMGKSRSGGQLRSGVPDSAQLQRNFDQRTKEPEDQVQEARHDLNKHTRVSNGSHSSVNIIQPALDRMHAVESRDQANNPIPQHLQGYSIEPDGYSTGTVGLQESFSNETRAVEQNESLPLDREISTRSTEVADIDDGYSRAPSGLQTAYVAEQKAVSDCKQESLEDEIPKRATENVEYVDGYSKEPIGLQTAFNSEQKAVAEHERSPLSEEILEKGIEDHDRPDGYSRKPSGLQIAFEKEQTAVAGREQASLEEEIPQRRFEGIHESDGYSQSPIGLQTAFTKECQAVADHTRASLEEEIPQREHEGNESVDGYSKQPIGLETAFSVENSEAAAHIRPSLAEEIERNDKLAVEAHLGLANNPEDKYTKAALGLQDSFGRELCDTSKMSLEEELQRMSKASRALGDDKARSLKGLQSLSGQENESDVAGQLDHSDVAKLRHKRAANAILDEEIASQKRAMHMYEDRHASRSDRSAASAKSLQGEGDICLNAAKYANSGKWYKQTNGDRIEKRENRDRALVREIKGIAEANGLMNDELLETMRKELEQKLSALKRQVTSRVEHSEKRLDEVHSQYGGIQHARPVVEGAQDVAWAEPPSYKLLAYDSVSDSIQTVTTTSNFTDKERPMSVKEAMSKIRGPALFMAPFASLQREGYQAMHASGDLLILRQLRVGKAGAGADDGAKATSNGPVNPVDGMQRTHTETATGNFASPTGFVNHDPVYPLGHDQGAATSDGLGHKTEDGIYYRHYPRVRRQEAVFSGSRRVRGDEDAHHDQRWRHRRERRGSWKRRVKFALSVGATSAVLVYALGVGAELAKGEKGRQPREGGTGA